MTVFYHFLQRETEDGKRLKPLTASTHFRCADWHPPKHPRFSIDLRGSSHSQMSCLELHSGKMPKVPRASSICSPLAGLHDEMRKDRGAGAIKGEELEWEQGGEGKRNYNQKCIGFPLYCKYGHFRGWEQKCLHITDTTRSFHILLLSIWYWFSWSYFWSVYNSTEQSSAESKSTCVCLKLSPSTWCSK